MIPTGSNRSAGSNILCPRCGAPVITTPDGELLNPETDPLGLHLPDGGRLDATQALPILAGRAPPRGHHRHAPGPYGCNPAPLTLF